MNESSFYKTLKKNLTPRGFDLQRIECFSSQGIPDICYNKLNCPASFGWIELKFLKQWPKKETTIVKLYHFTKYQRNWIYSKGKATGRVFLLWKVDKDCLLFDHQAIFALGSCTRGELLQQAIRHWHKKIDYKELENILLR